MRNIDEFLNGQSYDSYRYFGAHFTGSGFIFRVYAPHAKRVELIGEFNNWDGRNHVMKKVSWQGVFELFVPDIPVYTMYKYRIITKKNDILDKADPYAFYSELRPGSSSKTFNLDGYEWGDEAYFRDLAAAGPSFNRPLNIYEMHFNAWKRKEDGSSYSYDEIGPLLAAYLRENNFTHVEFLPLTEHPMDKSWGYQATGYYSITSRYGEPRQLMKLIDCLHRAGIGVIFDFVGAHLVKDSFGLSRFDGTYLYEYKDASRRENEWGTSNFDFGKGQTRSFLISCVNFYAEYYHVDGVRLDAVSNIIYYRGNKNEGVNIAGIRFLQDLNVVVHRLHPLLMTIAEDSSDYIGVTRPVYAGGLGFDYKWDLGWMNDTLKYYGTDPLYREYEAKLLSFSMYYFYSENFLLPLSHDEVVHGKKSVIDKMWGEYADKFAQLRNLYVYMYTHPGKKLNFAGNEIAHFREFDETKPVDWLLLDYPAHASFSVFFKDLTSLYLHCSALYNYDYDPLPFHYVQADGTVFVYYRDDGKETVLVILNMLPRRYDSYLVKVPRPGKYREIVNTDEKKYGGIGFTNAGVVFTARIGDNNEYYVRLKLNGFAAVVLRYLGK